MELLARFSLSLWLSGHKKNRLEGGLISAIAAPYGLVAP